MNRRRPRRLPDLRSECKEHLPWLLASCLHDRVPLNRIEVTASADCKVIVEAFMVEHEADIEEAISKVEATTRPDTNVTNVVDVLLNELLEFAREHADFLDKELSPYAGL